MFLGRPIKITLGTSSVTVCRPNPKYSALVSQIALPCQAVSHRHFVQTRQPSSSLQNRASHRVTHHQQTNRTAHRQPTNQQQRHPRSQPRSSTCSTQCSLNADSPLNFRSPCAPVTCMYCTVFDFALNPAGLGCPGLVTTCTRRVQLAVSCALV